MGSISSKKIKKHSCKKNMRAVNRLRNKNVVGIISQYRYFSVRKQPKRERIKRQRVETKKYQEILQENDNDDIWSWIGNNSYKWGTNMLWFNLKIIGGSIFFLQIYTVYEYFRFGKIKWINRVLWWIPKYLPQSINDKLKEISDNIDS